MPLNDYAGKAVLVTGGTHGIGRATGLAFGRLGAHVYLTHRWGSADEGELSSEYAAAGAAPPSILEADVASAQDTEALLAEIGREHDGLEAFVSNVSLARIGQAPGQLSRSGLAQSLKYSAWPLVGYLQRIRARFGRLPRYVIGLSSHGPDYCLPGYDYVASAKSVMETLCRYLAADLAREDVRVNVLRAWFVETSSLEATFGPEFAPFCKRFHGEEFFLRAEEVADAVLALCSGLMDAVQGETLQLDRGLDFSDNLVRLFTERERYGLAGAPRC